MSGVVTDSRSTRTLMQEGEVRAVLFALPEFPLSSLHSASVSLLSCDEIGYAQEMEFSCQQVLLATSLSSTATTSPCLCLGLCLELCLAIYATNT